MADKAISDLNAASTVKSNDLFVLQQDGAAKKLTGQTLINDLLKALDGHGGIQNIEKVSTSGLSDTYRLTFADKTTFDIVVTNGRGISSIAKTSTSGLKDTYTIRYNDGTSKTFTVVNGRSISDVSQTGVSGLVRTYTISFNDGTSKTFTVTDGRGITSFKKTGTSGLVDTYTVVYNDGTSTTLTVTNGKKGDKGDNTYTWVKYASQEPTEGSHSIGDVPDDWRGEYNGPLAEAPTDWKQYKWYKIKGDRGNTGKAATILSRAVEYQASDSGTIIPSGAWSTSIPVVAQGKYMWTRTTLTFNSGDPVVSYSVARMGLDGAGSVSSVNDVSPDSNGNVSLTAADVGALPSSGGSMTGGINMNGQRLTGLNSPSGDSEAATKGYVDNRTSGTLSSDRLPTVPISKGGTGATTEAKARSNLGTKSIVAIYGVAVTFDNGKVSYSNSAITSTSVCIVQRRSGTAGAATTSMFATTSGADAVTIVTDNKSMTTANLNIVIINP